MSLQDPRQRTRVFLLTYLDPSTYPALGHIYYDNGSTEASYAAMYAKPNVPLKLLYYGNKNYDVIFCIGEPDSTPLNDYLHKTYGYQEEVPITISAVDKDGATAQLMLWQAERKLRLMVETYGATMSLRVMKRTKPNQSYLGGFFEYTVEFNLSYTRSTDTVPTTPSITWGPSLTPTGTYIFPNIIDWQLLDPDTGDAMQNPPSRIGGINQILGMEDFTLKITCDLDVQPENLSWKRPQASTPKTDVVDWQVFEDIKFSGKTDASKIYQTLNLGNGATLPVRVTDIIVPQGQERKLELTLCRHSATNGSGGTYKAWYGHG